MDTIEAVEIFMPTLQPVRAIGRDWKMGFLWCMNFSNLTDRHERQMALGPTHEEVVTSLVRDELKSYRQLPLTVYQIQTKFRDEKRPRFGLLRGREFIMKDAYSFHSTHESLDEKYNEMMQAYSNIFFEARFGISERSLPMAERSEVKEPMSSWPCPISGKTRSHIAILHPMPPILKWLK